MSSSLSTARLQSALLQNAKALKFLCLRLQSLGLKSALKRLFHGRLRTVFLKKMPRLFLCFLKPVFFIPALLSVFSCRPDDSVVLSSVTGKDSDFFVSRRAQDPDRDSILRQSKDFYKGEACFSDPSCRETCSFLFALPFDQRDCQSLSIPQVRRFKRLYEQLEKGDRASLRAVSVFDLKIFLNFSPEPAGRLAKGLGFMSAKSILRWITDDWRVGQVFYEEDWDFFLLDILLNEIHFSPISSLREELAEGRTFVERAWIKQNDFALFWMEGRLAGLQCPLKESEKSQCVLLQYCRLRPSFKPDVLSEIARFESLRLALGQSVSQEADITGFCSRFKQDHSNDVF